MTSVAKQWERKIERHLVGRKITRAAYMTAQDSADLGWTRRALVIILDDGTQLFASADDEGNDAGAIFTSIESLPVIPVL